MKIYDVTDERFKKYGKVVKDIDFSGLVKVMEEETPLPDDVAYVPGFEPLEALPVMKELTEKTYGELPIQVGYCNGHNSMLNALEYHRDSEINVAAADAVLMLGLLTDVEADHTYDTSRVEAFLVPAGTAVEIYATTLHYAPCHAAEEDGFQVAIVLPRGTNYPLKGNHRKVSETKCGMGVSDEDAMLTAVNKWLLGHPEGGLEEGSFLGLKGKNLCLGDGEKESNTPL